MGLFSKRKKKQKSVETGKGPEVIEVGSPVEFLDVIRKYGAEQKNPCPDVLKVTQSCTCIECSRRNGCSLEAMARSTGCVGAFPAYCSLRNKERVTPQIDFGDRITKEWRDMMHKKHGIPLGIATKIVASEKEMINGKKEGDGIKSECVTANCQEPVEPI